MPDYNEFEPLYPGESEEVIAARWAEWANEGLDPDDDRRVDTEVGSWWWLNTRPGIREAARQYDLMGTETVMAALPQWSWGSYLDDHAERVGLERTAATYAEGTVIFSGPATTPIASGQTVFVRPANPDDEPLEFEVTEGGVIAGGGTVELPIRARETGAAHNVAADAIVGMAPPIAGVTVTNDDPTLGGADVEGDESLLERVLAAYREQGGANALFYERVARNYPGVGRATVIPLWDGPNTVRVIVLDANGDPVSAGIVAGLQELLDPVPGEGSGEAPVGAVVSVVTATGLNVGPTATIEFEMGYSLDGAGSTTALRPVIEQVLRDYIERVEPGSEVVLRMVIAKLMSIRGVHDVGSVSLSGAGGNGNVAIPADPPRVPVMTTPTLTAGTI